MEPSGMESMSNRSSNPQDGLVAGNARDQDVCARAVVLLPNGESCREDRGGSVHQRTGVRVIEVEPVNQRTIGEGRHRCGHHATFPDDRGLFRHRHLAGHVNYERNRAEPMGGECIAHTVEKVPTRRVAHILRQIRGLEGPCPIDNACSDGQPESSLPNAPPSASSRTLSSS